VVLAGRVPHAAARWSTLAGVDAHSGLTMFTYTADPGSGHEEALSLLGSWSAAPDPAAARER
jgi:hypothetical protein